MGAVVLLFNFIPIFGSIILTTAVVGSVLLHRRLSKTPSPSLADPSPQPAIAEAS